MLQIRFLYLISFVFLFNLSSAANAAAERECISSGRMKIGHVYSDGKLKICWEKKSAKSYKIFREDSEEKVKNASNEVEEILATSFPGAGVIEIPLKPSSVKTWIVVKAYDNSSTEIPNAYTIKELPPPLNKPVIQNVINNGDKTELSWNAVEGSDKPYLVTVTWDGGLQVFQPEKPSLAFQPHKYGVEHSFTVTASNSNGDESPTSDVKKFTPKEEPLSVSIVAGSLMTNLADGDGQGGFKQPWSFYAIETAYDFSHDSTGSRFISKVQGLFNIRFGVKDAAKVNKGDGPSYVKNADMVDVEIGLALYHTSGSALLYADFLPGFTFSSDASVKNFVAKPYAALGAEYNNKQSVFHRSYLEVGLGNNGAMQEPYGSSKFDFFGKTDTYIGRLAVNGRLYVLGKGNLRSFFGGSIDMDMGSGADEMRLEFGVEKGIESLFSMINNMGGGAANNSP